jgi:hypothetical protein
MTSSFSALHADRLPFTPNLILIFIRGCVDPSAILRLLEGLGEFEKSSDLIVIEPVVIQLVA